jgi:threonine dehydratase
MEISLNQIRSAQEIMYRALAPSPLHEHPMLSAELGLRAFIKHENHLPTGAFKVRGGLNFMHHFAAERTHNGVITATRGNHGASVAFAAKLHKIPATIVVPFGNNPEKNAAMKALGARLVEFGQDFDEARLEVERLSREDNLRYIHSANEAQIVNGVGSYALEIVETMQRRGEHVDAVFVPIGMGSGLCGVITAFRALSPDTKIYGVQAEGAPSYYLSWQAKKVVETEHADTFADGVATRCPSPFTLDIILNGVDEVVLVSDEEIKAAIRLLWRTTHNLAEGAGAAATAATIKWQAQLRGQTVVNVMSGGNLDTETLRQILC